MDPAALSVDVTCQNFEASLPAVEAALNGCTFFALDCEMTGLHQDDCHDEYLDDMQSRYAKIASNAQNFLVTQFGLSVFTHDPGALPTDGGTMRPPPGTSTSSHGQRRSRRTAPRASSRATPALCISSSIRALTSTKSWRMALATSRQASTPLRWPRWRRRAPPSSVGPPLCPAGRRTSSLWPTWWSRSRRGWRLGRRGRPRWHWRLPTTRTCASWRTRSCGAHSLGHSRRASQASTPPSSAPAADVAAAQSRDEPVAQGPRLFNSGVLYYLLGVKGSSGFGSTSTSEQVLQGVDLTGKTALITGGTSAIARHVVRQLCLRGAQVVVAAKRLADGEKMAAELSSQLPSSTAALVVLQADLSTLAGAAQLAAAFLALGLPLNNAATYSAEFCLTADNLESHFAVNHLAHFTLTRMLLPLLAETSVRDACECRVVNVACSAHWIAYRGPSGVGRSHTGVNPTQVEGQRAGHMFMPAQAYGQSKLAVIQGGYEMARRLRGGHVAVTVNSVHPGITAEGLKRYGGYTSATWAHYFKSLLTDGAASCGMLKSAELAAASVVYAAAGVNLAGVTGQYIADCNPAPPSPDGQNEIAAALLYQYSEQCVITALGDSALPELPGALTR